MPAQSIDCGSMELEEREYVFKRQKAELEQRIRDLEEEIDEVNDNYDLVQKVSGFGGGRFHWICRCVACRYQEKIKLKLHIEKLHQEKLNELNDKDDEIEHLKVSGAKKLKNIELQLEEDSLKRQSLIKDKREADRLVLELRQQLELQRDLGECHEALSDEDRD